MARYRLRSLEPLVLQVSPFCRYMTSTACKEDVLCHAHEHKSIRAQVKLIRAQVNQSTSQCFPTCRNSCSMGALELSTALQGMLFVEG